ncbi:MAG TPA: DUF1330 domain-containing protein [Mycobacteriales bacterium]|nr:DUF1330 domain-containing protein [Mycobacteriales bacterium]
MTAYVVVDVTTTDQDKANAYRALSKPSVERHGGHFVARGGETVVLEGSWDPERLVVIWFDSVAAARAWYESDDYREAREVRAGAGTYNMVVVEGVA